MTIDQLKARVAELRSGIAPTMSMAAVAACQGRVDIINRAVAALERLAEAQAVADTAVQEAEKWGV
jgi:hypothetical protein